MHHSIKIFKNNRIRMISKYYCKIINCKMLWATLPEFECIKKKSNQIWNGIYFGLVGVLLYPQHSRKKAIEENFFPSSTIAIWHGCIYIALFSKRKRKSAIHCIEVFCTLKNMPIFLTKWIILGPCMRKTGCFNLYSLLYLISYALLDCW